jgi:hypothetical protein
MEGDFHGGIDDAMVQRGLDVAEQYIPLEELKLALEHDLRLSRFILNRLGRRDSVPRERAGQLSMLRNVIAKARRVPITPRRASPTARLQSPLNKSWGQRHFSKACRRRRSPQRRP